MSLKHSGQLLIQSAISKSMWVSVLMSTYLSHTVIPWPLSGPRAHQHLWSSYCHCDVLFQYRNLVTHYIVLFVPIAQSVNELKASV